MSFSTRARRSFCRFSRRRMSRVFMRLPDICIRQHTSAYVSIRQHTSAYRRSFCRFFAPGMSRMFMRMSSVCVCVCVCVCTCTYVHFISLNIFSFFLCMNSRCSRRRMSRVLVRFPDICKYVYTYICAVYTYILCILYMHDTTHIFIYTWCIYPSLSIHR